MSKLIAILPGDGIGPEIIFQTIKILDFFIKEGLDIEYQMGLIGGSAYDKLHYPYPKETQELCHKADAILLGAVGAPQYEGIPRDLRPERGLLAIRKDLNLFANFRPAILYSELADASTLKKEVIDGLDILIIRELTGGIYFGEPRGIITNIHDKKEGFNTMRYNVDEIRRIAHIAFQVAQKRNKKICSVDKANVLETSELWREVMIDLNKQYPDVELTNMYVDNVAMQLIRDPKQFDVLVTSNLFGDILSDEASMLTGSIGMLPSASLNETGKGLYEPSHGSAPDIADKDLANPLATIMSLSMLFKYSFNLDDYADRIHNAVKNVLKHGFRTKDIYVEGDILLSCSEMGDEVIKYL